MRRAVLIIACMTVSSAAAEDSASFLSGAIYVVHSATQRSAQTQETGLAPGSLCDINVTGLYQPLGTLLSNDPVTIRFRAPGAAEARDLKILAVQPSPGSVTALFTALVPPDTPIGQAEIIAVSASGSSFSTAVWVAPSDFGIFTKTGAGYDAANAQAWRGAPQKVGLTTPVQAGEWVTLWGTGMGSADAAAVSVEIAGISVSPSYAGAAPGLAGVDQINFQVPAGVPDDCYVPIAVKVGRAGNTLSIAAATAAGPCHHRLGLTSGALATLDQGGQVPLSQSWVYSDVLPVPDNSSQYSRYDTVTLDFMEYDAAGVQLMTGLLNIPVAGCQLSTGGTAIATLLRVPPFDAGVPVVAGPGGARIPMDGIAGHYSTKPSDATYPLEAVPPSSFVPGDWSVEAPGGRDIAAFQIALRFPPPLRWTNRATISPVSRTNDLILTWDATGYTDREWMQGSIGVGAGSIMCQSPATTGSIIIPASLIAQLPAATTSTGTPMVELLLRPPNANPSLYAAPLVTGGSIPGLAIFSYLEMVWVEMR
jgi:uncharacterized protein (TIGR03437 family)